MPALAAITILDGKASPASHVFGPDNGQSDKLPASWFNRAATIMSGMESLTVNLFRSKTNKAAAIIQNVELIVPVVVNVAGVDTVVRSSKFKGAFYYAPDSSAAERKDLIVLVKNLFGNATFVTSGETPEPYWG